MHTEKKRILCLQDNSSSRNVTSSEIGSLAVCTLLGIPESKTFFEQAKYAHNLSHPVLQLFVLTLKYIPSLRNRRNVYEASLLTRIRPLYSLQSFLFFLFLACNSLGKKKLTNVRTEQSVEIPGRRRFEDFSFLNNTNDILITFCTIFERIDPFSIRRPIRTICRTITRSRNDEEKLMKRITKSDNIHLLIPSRHAPFSYAFIILHVSSLNFITPESF